MEAQLKSGKIIKGKLAETFCRLNLATQVKKAKKAEPKTEEVEDKKVQTKGRPKKVQDEIEGV